MLKVLLSLDWDYVTGDCSVPGDIHCGFCEEGKTESSRFGRGDLECLDESWEDSFDYLKHLPVPQNIPIWVAECHASIMEVIKRIDPLVVVDFDAHYDEYNCEDMLTCGNWVHHFEDEHSGRVIQIGELDKEDNIQLINGIFLCRSSLWTPKQMDEWFYELVWILSNNSGVQPQFIGHMKRQLKNAYYGRFENLRVSI